MKNRNQYTKLIVGENDFGSLYKEQSMDWDYDKNISKPSDFVGAGTTKVWWKCHICGYEWAATLDSRKNHGCMLCGQKKTQEALKQREIEKNGSFGDKFPSLIKYWDESKNITETPTSVSSTSTKKFFWICEKGHSFDRPINQFTKNNKCPVCEDKKLLSGYNDLQTRYPEIAQDWSSKNTKLPTEYLCGSGESVFWECHICHFQWKAPIWNRTRSGTGCKNCQKELIGKTIKATKLKKSGSFGEVFPELLEEWDFKKNSFSPLEVSPKGDTLVIWKCKKCGKNWETSVGNRTRAKSGCPFCNSKGTSFPEQAILYYISKYFPDAVGRYSGFKKDGITELDIWIPSLSIGIEYDGSYYHQNSEKDLIKTNNCLKKGIRLIRIKEGIITSENKDVIPCSYQGIGKLGNLSAIIKDLLIELTNEKDIFVDVEDNMNEVQEGIRKREIDESLAVKYPEIAKEWHPEKNGSLKPENFSVHNGASVWWKCNKCGYEWKTSISSRTSGNGCNKCSSLVGGAKHVKTLISKNGSLADKNPELCKEWNTAKNGNLQPSLVTDNSGKKVWWICSVCHGEWEAIIARRNKGVGCPYCSNIKVLKGFNDYESRNPELVKDWNKQKNSFSPDSVTAKNSRIVYWKCHKCGYEWKQKICYNKFGCPSCQNHFALRNKSELIIDWQNKNPDGTEKQCSEELKISMPTVRKWWNKNIT